MFRYTGCLDEAIQCFEVMKNFTDQSTMQLKATSLYHLGYTSFLNNDWNRCIENYQEFLEIPVSISHKRFRPYAGLIY